MTSVECETNFGKSAEWALSSPSNNSAAKTTDLVGTGGLITPPPIHRTSLILY